MNLGWPLSLILFIHLFHKRILGDRLHVIGMVFLGRMPFTSPNQQCQNNELKAPSPTMENHPQASSFLSLPLDSQEKGLVPFLPASTFGTASTGWTNKGPQGSADLQFCSPQPDTSIRYETMDMGPVHRMVQLLTPQLSAVPIQTAW